MNENELHEILKPLAEEFHRITKTVVDSYISESNIFDEILKYIGDYYAL